MISDYEINKQNEITEQIDDQGFAIVDFCSLEFIERLSRFYEVNEFMPKDCDGFYSTMHHKDLKLKKRITQFLIDQIAERAEKFLTGYKGLFANYLVKKAKTDYKVGLHHDWTYVDEGKFRSYNVWLPLTDTDSDNGGLYVIPKSHKMSVFLRGTPYDEAFYKIDESLIEIKSKPIVTKAGQAVIYDSALLHYSNENKSAKDRVVVAGIFIPDNAQPLHYFRECDILLKYNTDLGFYCNLIPGEKPIYNHSAIIDYYQSLNSESLNDFLKQL